jgi:hypothetical protein
MTEPNALGVPYPVAASVRSTVAELLVGGAADLKQEFALLVGIRVDGDIRIVAVRLGAVEVGAALPSTMVTAEVDALLVDGYAETWLALIGALAVRAALRTPSIISTGRRAARLDAVFCENICRRRRIALETIFCIKHLVLAISWPRLTGRGRKRWWSGRDLNPRCLVVFWT